MSKKFKEEDEDDLDEEVEEAFNYEDDDDEGKISLTLSSCFLVYFLTFFTPLSDIIPFRLC